MDEKEMFEWLELKAELTAEQAKAIGNYTERAYRESVLANQSAIMCVLAWMIERDRKD
jgi:hypothetical protein